jgi:hypothetical protein
MSIPDFQNIPGHPELDIAICIANSCLETFRHSIVAFALDAGMKESELEKVHPSIKVSFNVGAKDPFAVAQDKNTIILNQKYTDRITMLRDLNFEEGNILDEKAAQNEINILSIFYAITIIHELGHILLQFKDPTRLTPDIFRVNERSNPEGGSYLECSIFHGEAALCLSKLSWKVKSKSKVHHLVIVKGEQVYRVSENVIQQMIRESKIARLI